MEVTQSNCAGVGLAVPRTLIQYVPGLSVIAPVYVTVYAVPKTGTEVGVYEVWMSVPSKVAPIESDHPSVARMSTTVVRSPVGTLPTSAVPSVMVVVELATNLYRGHATLETV